MGERDATDLDISMSFAARHGCISGDAGMPEICAAPLLAGRILEADLDVSSMRRKSEYFSSRNRLREFWLLRI